MDRISITVDLGKIDRTRIVERKYTNKEGQEVTVKEYKMDVVLMKPENHKTVSSGQDWAMVKKYFVANSATKEERAAKVNTAILGEGIVFVDMKSAAPAASSPSALPTYPAGEIDEKNIPF